jgi:hypothetical protein
MFGDTRLIGVVKQKIEPLTGDLLFKGIIHFFGSKLPVNVEIKPTNKALKGERLYYVYSFLPFQKYRAKTIRQKQLQRSLAKSRSVAETKVRELLDQIGIIYDYKENKQTKAGTNKKTNRKRKAVSN